MRISYAIPVCNEHVQLEKLLSFLVKHIDENDEIVVQCDQGNTTPEVYEVLGKFKSPENIFFFEELPKGSSGKIQRLKIKNLIK